MARSSIADRCRNINIIWAILRRVKILTISLNHIQYIDIYLGCNDDVEVQVLSQAILQQPKAVGAYSEFSLLLHIL